MSTVPNMPTVTDVLPTGISRLEVNAVVVTTVLTVLGTLLAILRFCIRRKEALGVDDYILMVALVFLQLQLAFCYMIGFLSGSGWEMQDLVTRPDRITWILKLIYFPELNYTVVVVLIKTSILYSYKRIFGRDKTTKYHIYALLGLSWAWGVAFFLTIVFQCTPVDKAWMPEIPGYCIPVVPFLWGNSISNFIIDWMILLVPVVPVLKLQLPTTQKVLVVLSFLFGSLACIASTVRSAATSTFDPNNLGISDYNASIWVYIEAPLATVSCCLPFLSRIFGVKALNVFHQITSRITKGSTKGSSSLPSEVKGSNVYDSDHTRSSGDKELLAEEGAFHDYRNIHMTTTTSINSRALREQESVDSYQFYITSPAATLPKNGIVHAM